MSSPSSPACRRPNSSLQRTSVADWSNLPYDLIALIANKFHALDDFLAFSGVCHSWRLVHLNKNWNPSNRSPWLFVDVNHKSEALIRRISNECTSNTLKFRLPVAKGRRCWGSSYGWLVTIDNDLVIGLLNPITRVFIHLPPHYTLGERIHTAIDWLMVINKANVLKIRDGFVTLVTLGMNTNLYFARAGDRAWTTVGLSYSLRVASVMCFKDQIYAACANGTLLLVEIDGPNPPWAEVITLTPNREIHWKEIHLVESLGDLLMIFRYTYRDTIVKFKVYKFDFSTKEWMILESLGDRVIFVGDSHSLSIPACKEFGRDNIYYVEECSGWEWGLKQDGEWQYCGVFHMEDKSIETLSANVCNLDGCFPPYAYPSWMIPFS